jgi:hypothetical protein
VKRAANNLEFTALVFVVGIAGQVLGACSKPAESPKLAPARTAIEEQSLASLRMTSESVLSSIKANDPEVFIGYASEDGVCFGIDCDPEPFKQMLKDMNSKSGFYCLLFDTKCERRIVSAMWKASKHTGDINTVLSFHDSLQSAHTRKISYSPEGRVSIEFEQQNGTNSSNLSSLTLGFVQEHGSWQLNVVEWKETD